MLLLGHLGNLGVEVVVAPRRARVPMHRLHWYPTERSAVAHAAVAQSLGDVVGVEPLLMSFTGLTPLVRPTHAHALHVISYV